MRTLPGDLEGQRHLNYTSWAPCTHAVPAACALFILLWATWRSLMGFFLLLHLSLKEVKLGLICCMCQVPFQDVALLK